MFDDTHYVPILKSKAGELMGLAHTAPAVCKEFTPLIELTPVPPKWLQGEDEPIPSKSIDEHVEKLSKAIAEAWKSDARLFVDGTLTEYEDSLGDGREPVEGVLDSLVADGLTPVPVIGLDNVAEYGEAIQRFSALKDNGAALRIVSSDLENVDELPSQIDSILKFLRLKPTAIDLVVDFGVLVPEAVGAIKSAIRYQLAAIPYVEDWRSLTISGSGFPPDLTHMAQHTIDDEVARTEWELWLYLRKHRDKLKGKRLPTFGDYAITNPELTELDPRKIRMAPKIKYTHDLAWVVAKGEAYRRKKDEKKSVPAAVQYPEMAKLIMQHPAWKSAEFSWGDEYIANCAAGNCVGGMKEWVAVGTAHHLAFVVQQLANLHEPSA